MKNSHLSVGCAGCPMHRRKFLAAGSAAACACSLGLSFGAKTAQAEEGTAEKKKRIRVIYSLHAPVQPCPDWPNIGFDFRPVMQKANTKLAAAFPSIEFLPVMAKEAEEAKAIVEKDKTEKIDGYIVFQLNCWNHVIQTVVPTEKPTLYVDYLFGGSGGFLVFTSRFLAKNAKNFGFISSSKFDDVLRAVGYFQTCTDPNGFADMVTAVRKACTPKASGVVCKPDEVETLSPEEWKKKLGESKILAFKNNKPSDGKVQDYAGVPLIYLPFSELNAAWEVADKDQAKEIAAKWTKGAQKIEDVSQAEIENSAAMYLGQKALLKKYGADAITVNCLGGFYGDHIHAYPCLGFHELCNEGLIGGCECDLRSAASMVAWKTLTGGRTGFISDPAVDVSTREIIYAHCTASTRAFGPDGPTNPYQILTHSEDRMGAAVRSLYPEGYMTTTIQLDPRTKEILFHQARTTGNSLEDKACRTKLKGEVIGDFEKMFTQWSRFGWHRVTVYGDLKDQVYGMADVLGWKVVKET
jgi:hypothetical protein